MESLRQKSNNWDDDPLASPLEPVTDWPDSGEPTIEFDPGELFHLLYDDGIIAAYLASKMDV